MYVGAILTVPPGLRLPRESPESGMTGGQCSRAGSVRTIPIGQWDLLGKSVLDRVVERFRMLGVVEISVIHEQSTNSTAELGHSASNVWAECEATIWRYLQFKLETLLLVRVGPYLELDLADFLRFHREISSPMTQVYDQHGALDLIALDARCLAQGTGSLRSRLRTMIPTRQGYNFKGYANRLASVADFRLLVQDALWGRSAIRPMGHEVCAKVWLGEKTRIARSVRILPPAYIGKRCRLAPGCTITGVSSIEQQCEIDCGTVVDDSCILACSYVGAGLNVAGGVVCQETFFHLRRDVQLQFNDSRFLGKNFTGWKRLYPVVFARLWHRRNYWRSDRNPGCSTSHLYPVIDGMASRPKNLY